MTRTGDTDAADALMSLLGGVSGRTFGLPQQSESSDALAEAFISVIHRRLVRSGLQVWRYNDDFRIAAPSWSEALDAVDCLEREARLVGLALNDSKTVIRRRDTYEGWLGRHDHMLKEISDEVEVDLTDWLMNPYGEVHEIEPDQKDLQLEAARRVVEKWFEARNAEHDGSAEDRETGLVLTELLRVSLPMLKDQPPDGHLIQWCAGMLRMEQSMTPAVARYLEGVATEDPGFLATWFEEFLRDRPYLTPWQALWIAPAVGQSDAAFLEGSIQREWLLGLWNDRRCPEPVVAGLAYTMAVRGLLTEADLLGAFDFMSDIGRPLIARALGALVPATKPGAAAVIAEDELSRWSFELGAQGV